MNAPSTLEFSVQVYHTPSFLSFDANTKNISGTPTSQVKDDYVLLSFTDTFGSETFTALYLYAKGSTNWNDTVIFFVTFLMFSIIFIIGMILIIVFRKYFLDE